MGNRVFISYSWKDQALARRLERRLIHNGVEVFRDESRLRPGAQLSAALKHEIAHSSHVAVVWTKAAAGSRWVREEIAYAQAAEPTPVLVPLLFDPPGEDSPISDYLGIDFRPLHRFEGAFERIWIDTGLEPSSVPDRDTLARDLAATLAETPSIASIFEDPISTAVSEADLLRAEAQHGLPTGDLETRGGRADVLAKASAAFEAWKPGRLSVSGLPVLGEPQFHALEFAMWCGAGIALRKTDELHSLVAPEIKAYPALFAKVLGSTGAGFDAIVLMLTRFPGLAPDPLLELIESAQVHDSALTVVVDLYEALFKLASRAGARDQFVPFDAAHHFVAENLHRLTDSQKRVFLTLADINGNGPYPGGPLDMLAALYGDGDPSLSTGIVERVRFWLECGLFDRRDPKKRAEAPRLFYGFVSGLIERKAPAEQSQLLMDAASNRIRKLLRAGNVEAALAALRWIADACQLPREWRLGIEQGVSEGLYSTEFESSEHASLVGPLARELSNVVVHGLTDSSSVMFMVQTRLREAGLPDQ